MKVKLGEKAQSFTDQYTGFSISKGQIKDLNAHQLNTKKIKAALNSGHLVRYYEGEEKEKGSEVDYKAIYEEMLKKYEAGMEIKKIAKGYKKAVIEGVVKSQGLEPEDKDTPITLLEALFEKK